MSEAALPDAGLEARAARFRATNAMMGMVIFVASWAMLFASLLFAYGIVRARTPVWPPLDLPRLPLGLPAVATVALAASSAAVQGALGGARRSAPGARVATGLGAGALLGLLFLGLQVLVWRALWTAGLRPETGTYASVFYGLTAFHALHVAVGIAPLAFLAVRARRGVFRAEAHVPVRLWTLYWHMVGVIWAVMFLSVYLV